MTKTLEEAAAGAGRDHLKTETWPGPLLHLTITRHLMWKLGPGQHRDMIKVLLASNNNQWIQWDNEGKILSLDASSLGRVANF